MAARIEEPWVFRALVTFLNAKLNAGCVKKETIEDGAGVEASKLEHQHRCTYAQESATTAAAGLDEVIHVVKGTTGTLKTFVAGNVVANVAGATITVDLLKNGVSILDAAIELDNTDLAYIPKAGVIDTAAVVADDVLEVVVTVAAGGGTIGKGVFAALDLWEDVD